MPNVAKILLFQKPLPVPIHSVEQNITLTIGKERYAMTIHTKIERVTRQPVDRPSPDFERSPETIQNTTSTVPTVDAHAPDVARRAGKTRKKAKRSGKLATREPLAKIVRETSASGSAGNSNGGKGTELKR